MKNRKKKTPRLRVSTVNLHDLITDSVGGVEADYVPTTNADFSKASVDASNAPQRPR